MGLWASLFYFFDLIIFIIYFLFKFFRRRFIFSCFNISLFTYYFSIFISPIYYNSAKAWIPLGVENFQDYFVYLDKTIVLNSIGFIISIFAMAAIEFSKGKRGEKKVISGARKINSSLLNGFFWIVIVCWYVITLGFNGGLPLLNGGRTFFLGSLISPIYQALNQIILLYALYFGTSWVYRDKIKDASLLKTIISLATLLFTGNRGTVLLSAFVPIALLYINDRTKRSYTKKTNRRVAVFSWRVHALVKTIVILFIVLLAGLLLTAVRSGSSVNIASMITEFIYGNTFSDMRDGAFILSGYDQMFHGQYLWGRTYLAGILSIIPSGISPFMVEWRWGRFSTSMLFGWSDHFGLRGGNAMEAYLNFGILGVCLFSVVQGLLNGFFEKIFYHEFLLGDDHKDYIQISNVMLLLMCLSTLGNFFVNTAALYNIYVSFIFYIIICFPIKISRKARIEHNLMINS